MGFAEVISGWRQRLARLVGETAQSCYASIERKVLRYFLWRHADAPYAVPPAQAERLPPKDARRSAVLSVNEETRQRLGLQRGKNINVIEDLHAEDWRRALLICVPGLEDLVAVEIHPHPRWHGSLVEVVVRTEDPDELARITGLMHDCQPVLGATSETSWQALVHFVRISRTVEFEVSRTPAEESATYVRFHMHYGDAPRFRNDGLGEVLQQIAARVGAWPEEKAMPGEPLEPAGSFPEL
jgi:hypothetical protein